MYESPINNFGKPVYLHSPKVNLTMEIYDAYNILS